MTTVLLTGISGFVAKRIAFDLLEDGYTVKGSLRSLARADEVRRAITPKLTDPAAIDRLSFTKLDLTSDDGWDAAMAGVDAVIHTASPFPLGTPKDESVVIKPAVDGTLRALTAAQKAGVTRVVLTASMESVMHGATSDPISETDFSNPDAATCSAYTRSKIFAERAAWDFVAQRPEMQLTVINPGMVCGTPMDGHYGTSINVVKRLFSGKDPMLPDMSLPYVDIENVSQMHVRALSRPETIGKRYVAAASFETMADLGASLAAEFPERGVATKVAPNWLIRLLGLFDRQIKQTTKWLGWHPTLTNGAAQADLGISFTPAHEAVLRSARFLASEG
ncbi:NAD-dependent epimerase/dehydratase family protein [Actibacterium sp.]|uniref:NAD-dependent epimerase/dehydratase family protein n=1 Tax=Actibacterium sp. TaxID=1872125 RepID=UPI003567BF0A